MMDKVLGVLSPVFVYALIFLLNYFLPGKWVSGYVRDKETNEKLRYRLNGLYVLVVIMLLWFLTGYTDLIPWDYFYTVRWYSLAGAVIIGLIFSIAVVLPYAPVKKSFLADFYLGRIENLQWWHGRIDAKMWLYLVGAVMLEINVLSFAAHHHLLYGADASIGIFISAGLLTYFVIDYLTFEEVHLYTYDLFAERVGFKLGWGCLAFYPFFYAIPLWATVDLPDPGTSSTTLVAGVVLFFCSWSLSRGANLQKFYFKKDPTRSFLGMVPEVITDGQKTLLVNGFWGLSRHINYLGEIGMATAIVICVGHPTMLWPWLYPLYYVALLLPRQMDDDKRCELKYGPLWTQYKKKVKYRIIPYVY